MIFPEASHNYHLSNLINPLFDGPANLALKTGKKIVPITLLRDDEYRVSYMDVCNPIDVRNLHLNVRDYYPGVEENEKYRVKACCNLSRTYWFFPKFVALSYTAPATI
ncbi:MAG: hypothetical protein NC123_19340, partial [Butyrivibrio sp.]|nr:hypothetical protein [Butyrivibrio sp.]